MKTTIRKIMTCAYRVVNLLAVLMMVVSAPTAAFAYTETDLEDYAPGSTVTVFGDNSDGAGYLPGETVLVTVTQPVLADPLTCEGVVNEAGAWSCQLVLSSDPALAVGLYAYTTLGLTSGFTEAHFFTDANPAANLDQCANGINGDEPCLTPDYANWVNGNLGASKSKYYEGDSIPYRLVFTNLTLGEHTVVIEWDTTQGGKHALDYLTTWDRSANPGSDPTSGVDSSFSAPTTFAILADPQVTDAGVTAIAGVFTFYNGSINSVSAYSYPLGTGWDGNKSAQIAITFTVTSSTAVLAWGGHIAERADWGMDMSAVAISGSPYHTRLISLDGKGGNQDRSLSADAVIYPASIEIIKEASPHSAAVFPFTAGPAPLINFNLVDNGTDPNYKLFSDIETFTTYTITENTPTSWNFGSLVCDVTSANGGSQTVLGATATIVLKEGENVTCTYTNTIIGQDLTISKTATPAFGRTYTWDIYKNVDKTKANIPNGSSATFNYTVGVTHDSGTDSGWAVSGVIKVTNPNSFDVIVDITDSAPSGSCAVTNGEDVSVPASSYVERNYTCTFASNPGSGTNTATATWDAATYYTPGGTASGTANYDFSTVTPSITNSSVTVTDTLGGDFGPVYYTDPSPTEFKYSHTFYGVGGTCTKYDNTATINENGDFAKREVEVCMGKDLTVSKTATASKDRLYKWLIDKSVDDTRIEIAEGGTATFNYSVKVTPDGYTDSGYTLGGTITIANPNDWEDVTVSVADTLDLGGTCSITEAAPYVVPKSGSLELHYTCATDGTTTKNTATVTWDKNTYFTPTGSASREAAVTFAIGTETNKTITVIDDKTDPLNPVTLGTWNWADGEHTFTYSLSKAGVAGTCTDYTNTTVIDETKQSDNQTVTVCVGKDLTVTKTAAGTFDRTYFWKIDKSVDDTRIEIAEGGTATFNYSVKVTPDGFTDNGWTLGGKITVSNPNDWEDITADVTDTFPGGVCTVTGGDDVVIPEGKSVTLNYSCTFASQPSYSGTNTAVATWNKALYFTPNGSASGTASTTLTLSGETNRTITVVDDKTDPLNPVTLGISDYYTGPFEYTYALGKTGVAGTCTDYTNTAVIDEIDQSDSQKVTVCVGKDLTVSKTAAGTFNRTYLWKISKDVNATEVKIAEGGSYTFHYTVDVEQTGISDAAWGLSGKITISNPNDWEDITLNNLTDVVDNGGSCTVAAGPYVIPKSGSLDVNYSCSYASAPTSYSGKNTATATWDSAAYFTPSGSANGEKSFTLSQLGSTNKMVHVTDSYAGDLGSVTATDSAPFTKASFTYDRTESGVAGTCTKYDNTATITETGQTDRESVTLCVGKDLTVSKTAAGTFNRTYLWKISKDVDKTLVKIAEGGSYTFKYTVDVEQTGISDAGWTLSGKITITNPNDWEAITLTSLADVVDNGGLCTVDPGPYMIPKSGSLDVNYSCSFASLPTSYSGKNTATATWDKAANFTPSGSASGDKSFTLSQLGSTNKTVHVTDTYGGDLGTVTATDEAPYATATFMYDRKESGVAGTCTKYDNTAAITETGQSADKSVTLCVGKDLTVSKTAAGTFDRTYKWLIEKKVDKTSTNIAMGGTATFNYTVEVTPDGYTDSGWLLSGKITVANPNDWEDITADVTDVYAGGGTCAVTGGEDVVVPAGGSVTLDYRCTFSSQPAYTGKNTATATWDAATYFTPTGTASGTTDVTLTLKGETNRVITVVDDKTDPAHPVTLGTSDYYAGPFEFKYSLDKTGVAGKCTDYTNTAVIDETDQSDSQTVTVCVGKDLTVSKTAVPTFTRTWTWDIVKDFDGTYNLFAGDTVTHGYKVAVNPTSTDSLWKVVGTITISNPNDWEDITASVSDATDLGGSCNITESAPYVVPKGGSLVLHYTCAWATQPTSYTGTNTASVTWNSAAYFTPSGAANGTAGFVFDDKSAGNPTEINPVITVDDNNLIGENWSVDRAAGEWTYTKDFTCSTNPSLYSNGKYSFSVINTATINESGQNDTATVDVTCYWPQIELTKTGDTLSKIGDDVTYTIKLENNTPTDAGLRALSCSISDPTIGFSKSVMLASGASDTSTKTFTIPSGAADPFVNTASVTCSPLSSTFSVSDSSIWSTNLFQPAVEIIKGGPANSVPGKTITYTFTINNKSSSDSPNLALDSVSDSVLGNLMTEALAAGCDDLAYNGSCSFTKDYMIPDGENPPALITNVVTVHYHPAGFPNDIHDSDDHTVTIVNQGQLTDTSYCPLPNNHFRLLYHNETVDTYRLQSSNPGQFYYNAFYFGEPGEVIAMTIEIPYPFITQEGAGNPIQVHDGSGMTSSGCYAPWPSVPGFDTTTYAMTPTSPAGNQIITPEDYTTKAIGSSTTVTVSGVVPSSGVVYVTIHLDYGLKKTGGWMRGAQVLNPANGLLYYTMSNSALGLTILGVQPYHFERTVGADTVGTDPESYNEVKKVNGFQGWVTSLEAGDPIAGVKVKVKDPYGVVLGTVYTDENGYYRLPYNTIKNGLIYTVKFPEYLTTFKVTRPKGAPAIITNLEIP